MSLSRTHFFPHVTLPTLSPRCQRHFVFECFFIKLTLTLTVTVTRFFACALTAEPTVPAGEYRLVMQRELEALGGPVIKLHSLRNVPHAEGRAQKGVSIKMWLADSSGDYVQIYTHFPHMSHPILPISQNSILFLRYPRAPPRSQRRPARRRRRARRVRCGRARQCQLPRVRATRQV